MSLSVVVHTKNAAATLPLALKSVSFADELIVIDMQSSDDTVSVAKEAGAVVYSYEDLGFADPARNFGIEQATSDWILVLDADEEVSVSLASWILSILKSPTATEAYFLPRTNIIFGKALAHTGWWPDYQLRFFKKGIVKWKDGVHQMPQAQGKIEYLPIDVNCALIHHNYQTLDQFIDRLNRYTTIKAAELSSDSKAPKAVPEPVTIFSQEFLSRFFAHQGIKDGVHGLSLSLLQATYELVVSLKVWQTAGFKPESSERQSITQLRQWQQELNYWLADWEFQQASSWQKWWWRLRRKYKW